MTTPARAGRTGPDRRLAPAAVRLGGLAAQVLGWRPDEFWRATPAELAGVLLPPAPADEPLTRTDLVRMMEHDNA